MAVTRHALVVVESPAKVKTIQKYLAKGFVVKASLGHLRDLPSSKLGVDVKKNFAPQYVPVRSKAKTRRLRAWNSEGSQLALGSNYRAASLIEFIAKGK